MGEKYTDAQKKASIKYLKEKTDSIQIRTRKGTKERWKNAAADHGKSLNQFIVDTMEDKIKNEAIDEKMAREEVPGQIPDDPGPSFVPGQKEVGRERILRDEDGGPERDLPADTDDSGRCECPRRSTRRYSGHSQHAGCLALSAGQSHHPGRLGLPLQAE